MYTKEEQETIQKAVTFLTDSFNKTGNNPKPVILHSIRTAMYLYERGVDSIVVVGALLHDLLEDTQADVNEMREKFGEGVVKLVEANSFKSEIADYVQKYIETFQRTIAAGAYASLIKAADLLDNADYYKLGQSDSWQKLYGKFSKFVELSQPVIGDTEVWKDLQKKQEELKVSLGIV